MTPTEIDFLLEYIEELTPEKLELKKEPFLNLNMENYLLSNFVELKDYIPEKYWEQVGMKYMSLYQKLQVMHEKYGKIVVDYYLAKVKEIYQIPEDKIQFQIEDTEQEVECCKIENEDVEEEPDFNQALQDEINHLHLKNALVNGGALYNWDKLFDDIKDDLDLIDKDIYPTVTQFCKYAQFVAYSQIPVRGMDEMIAGSEQIQFPEDEEKTIVKVKGTNFVIVCHEILKGVYDIYAEHSFPRHLPPFAQKYVRKITSDFYYERWAWLYARKMFNVHINSKYNNDIPYYKYLFNVFKKNYSDLLTFLVEV